MYRILPTLQQTSAKLPEIYPFFFTKSFLSTLKTLLQALHNVLDYVHLDSFLAITRLPCPDSRLSFKNLCSF